MRLIISHTPTHDLWCHSDLAVTQVVALLLVYSIFHLNTSQYDLSRSVLASGLLCFKYNLSKC